MMGPTEVFGARPLDMDSLPLTPYLFFTGKGGVGKTSVACTLAVALADKGKRIMLVSTDPASNLQDVFGVPLNNKGTPIPSVPNLTVANFDPEQAAAEYREGVVAPFRGKLPDSVVRNMEEQLSGSCTVEVAAFNEFTGFITNTEIRGAYDHIIFDTAPTGHTLRMLQLPSAWSDFIAENTTGASCLGQLSGLEGQKETYAQAVRVLADGESTTLVLVTRPERIPLAEAERASGELKALGIGNQILIINGVLATADDPLSRAYSEKQQLAMRQVPSGLATLESFWVPLRPYEIAGVDRVRAFLKSEGSFKLTEQAPLEGLQPLSVLADRLYRSGKKIIFTMGKGGVGKTSIAAALAGSLVEKGLSVHLATTDPAGHLGYVATPRPGLTISAIDEKEAFAAYREEVLKNAGATLSADDLAYLEEDLRSPCTQEIAVFRAFAEIVDRAKDQVVVIDTAPTGHTLLLLDATLSYHHEVERTHGNVPESVLKLLPRLRDDTQTEVVIVTLAEMTPVHEAQRLAADLRRAGIERHWWVINGSLYGALTENAVLRAKAAAEIPWIRQVEAISGGDFAVVGWKAGELAGDELYRLMEG